MKKLYRLIFFTSIIITGYLSIVSASDIPAFAALGFISDKIVHSLVYFLIALSGLYSGFRFSNFLFLTLVFSFGFLIEMIHYFHPYRYFELADLVANLVGILLALFIFTKKIA